jgi:hypothetical protein
MKTFLGVGLGPIQTGIFLDGASRGGFDRMVIAEVDAALISSVRAADGIIRISIAGQDAVTARTIRGIEIYSPANREEVTRLVHAASLADEVATALPSITSFQHLDWLRQGFSQQPERQRLVYAAENHNHAAEELEKTVGGFPNTRYLNTVIGKMSCVLSADECTRRGLPTLTSTCYRGHLVEEFNRILIQSCDAIEERRVQGLTPKPELLPFEEAKLYGHNAAHLWLGLHAKERGLGFMHELGGEQALIEECRSMFLNEIGAALCAKWGGVDQLFTSKVFAGYADDLLVRMVNPLLQDPVTRVCRGLERKLSWDDRLVGAMRLALSQGIPPVRLGAGAAIAAVERWGSDAGDVQAGLENLWGSWSNEADTVWSHIAPCVSKRLTHA